MLQKRPNILLITTDTQRCDTLACMGHPAAISPNLDRLAREGVLFEQAHTCVPVCGPARTSLLTGVYPPVHGALENGIDPISGLIPFTDLLADAGYFNIMVGKTHFGPTPASFHVQHVLGGEKNHDADDFYSRHVAALGFSRISRHPNPVPEGQFIDSHCVDVTIREIQSAVATAPGRPFFAFCSMPSPHAPFDPPGKWAGVYRNRELPCGDDPDAIAEAQLPHIRRLLGMMNPTAPRGADDLQLYYGSAAYCDAQVGRLLHYLDASELRRDTLVIFSSDHGQTRFDTGLTDKHNFHDTSWRVPLILSQPGTLPENQRRQFAAWTDLTATILAAGGVRSDDVQGLDLYTPLRNGAKSPRRCSAGTLFRAAAIVTQRWKLVYSWEDGVGHLFDRQDDPDEQHDLYSSPPHAAVRATLSEGLLGWYAGLEPLQLERTRLTGGGPVATRVAAMVRKTRAMDAELRLNDVADAADTMFINSNITAPCHAAGCHAAGCE